MADPESGTTTRSEGVDWRPPFPAEDSRRVHAHLAGLRAIDFAGRPGDLAYEQWQAWMKLQAIGGREIPPDFKLPSVGLAWSAIVTDLDPRSRYRAFEASTMMALRKSLRRGSVWVNHSIGHRSSCGFQRSRTPISV